MGLSKKEMQQEIHDLEQTIQAYRNLIRVTTTNMSNTEFVNRSIESHEEKIKWHQNMIADLVRSRDDGPEIIKEAKKNIIRLKKKLAATKHRRDIERLLKLQAEINRLEEDA